MTRFALDWRWQSTENNKAKQSILTQRPEGAKEPDLSILFRVICALAVIARDCLRFPFPRQKQNGGEP